MTNQLKTIITNEGEATVFQDILDEATNQALKDRFYFRYVCDDDEKFLFYFHRNLNLYKKQYNDYLRIENIKVDPFVTDYKERQVITAFTGSNQATETGSGSASKSEENGGTVTRQTSLTGQGTSSGSSSGTAEFSTTEANTGTVTDQGTSSDTATSRRLYSNTPQANVSAATVGGLDQAVAWTYATELEDNRNQASGTNSNTNTQNTQTATTGESENTTTTSGTTSSTQTGSETLRDEKTKTTTNTNSSTLSKTNTTNDNTNVTERYTGRNGFKSSEILQEMETYIKQSNAFDWLCNKLEKCFISSLLYEED